MKSKTLTRSTVSAKPGAGSWYVVDAADQVLGRLATRVAHCLRGKHRPDWTPHVDAGDHVIVLNASSVRVTGNKRTGKMYHHHTGYIGNLRSESFEDLQERAPQKVIELAVRGMLPKSRLGSRMLRRLHVYSGGEHQHAAQQPAALEI